MPAQPSSVIQLPLQIVIFDDGGGARQSHVEVGRAARVTGIGREGRHIRVLRKSVAELWPSRAFL